MRNCFAIPLTMSALCLSGCGEDPNVTALRNYKRAPDTDISADPRYNFASFAGTVWKTKDKTALASGKLYTGVRVSYLLPPIFFDASRTDYRAPDGDVQIMFVLPAGARLRVDRLTREHGIGNLKFVIGELSDGTNTHKNVIVTEGLIASGPIHELRAFTTNWVMDAELFEEEKK